MNRVLNWVTTSAHMFTHDFEKQTEFGLHKHVHESCYKLFHYFLFFVLHRRQVVGVRNAGDDVANGDCLRLA